MITQETTLTMEKNPKEYTNLTKAAAILTALSTNGTTYHVADCYLDYGADWMWTTILAHRGEDSWQAVSRRDWKNFVAANYDSDLLVAISNKLA